jgi:gliding motility-associated-like protein
VDNQSTATYTFTPDAGQCAISTTFTYEVNDIPVLTARTDTTVYDGDVVPEFNFTSTPASVINWTNDNTGIGLAASGSGKIPSFVAVNMTNAPVTATITATPRINGCAGNTQSYKITVLPIDKDVFVPNVFSPNGDGRNDLLYVYGNYIDKVDMRIFNQWGQQIFTISNKSTGWDGRANGAPQPVGVYVYTLKALLTNGKTVNLKGSITLVR